MQAGFEIFIHTERTFLALLTYHIFNEYVIVKSIKFNDNASCSKDRWLTPAGEWIDPSFSSDAYPLVPLGTATHKSPALYGGPADAGSRHPQRF